MKQGKRCYRDDEEPEKEYVITRHLDSCEFCGQDHETLECPNRPIADWLRAAGVAL